SLNLTETSPSSNRDTSASPSGTFRFSQIETASRRLALPAKRRQGSTRDPPIGRSAAPRSVASRGPPPGPRDGWGGRIRTSGCEIQSLVPYRLATPHQQNGISVTVRASPKRQARGDGHWPKG